MCQAAILCVDDEVLVLESIEIELKKTFKDDYLYEFAESADEALEIIDELIEDGVDIVVIVSDWLMPGMKGDELLVTVHRKYPRIITIMLTGQADLAAIERAKNQAQLHALLHKPWDTQELIAAIKSGLAKL
ncbi:response regulator [Limnofasciculus baicalensis]|uniref:Response regulator n=1 Tax=Limnofasciculus baicalensis BBK-W-15 TaxID=2699891 RepID=A0AAE3GQV0_9CYAN|nr:response regulator [Limnofasciculus baicalensis]MCP2728397.1 response regulator [Limnofasciculus baicalensis BBK-W-15]